jgi:hypothetical protein
MAYPNFKKDLKMAFGHLGVRWTMYLGQGPPLVERSGFKEWAKKGWKWKSPCSIAQSM